MIRITLTDHYMLGPKSEIEEVSKKELETAKRETSKEYIQALRNDITVIISEEAYEVYIDE